MLLIDDLLLLPAKSMMFVFQEIYKGVLADSANEAGTIRTRLSQLYMMLESKQITSDEFDAQEKPLLDRLELIESRETITQERFETEPGLEAEDNFETEDGFEGQESVDPEE